MYSKAISILLLSCTLLSSTATAKSITEQEILDAYADDVSILNGRAVTVTIVESNMPALMEIDAVNYLKTAYELAATDDGKVQMFSSMFGETYTEYKWDVLYDYADVSFTSKQYIILKVGTHYFLLFATL